MLPLGVLAASLAIVAAAFVWFGVDGGPPRPGSRKTGSAQRRISRTASIGELRASLGPATQPLAPPAHNGRVVAYAGSGMPLMFKPSALAPTTIWLDLQGSTYVDVFAGAPAGSRRGAIVVIRIAGYTGDDVAGDGPTGVFNAPETNGPLTMTKVIGGTVRFAYPRGSGTFDLRTGSFSLHPSP